LFVNDVVVVPQGAGALPMIYFDGNAVNIDADKLEHIGSYHVSLEVCYNAWPEVCRTSPTSSVVEVLDPCLVTELVPLDLTG
jgi:hypothetical protein